MRELWFACTLLLTLSVADGAVPTVDFNRDVRPILSDHCFACHGPDEADRQAGLRLDTAEGLADVLDVDDPDGSELIYRATEEDPDVVMPPPEYHKPLSQEQIDTLRRWIAGGGWSHRPVCRMEMASDPAGRRCVELGCGRHDTPRIVRAHARRGPDW